MWLDYYRWDTFHLGQKSPPISFTVYIWCENIGYQSLGFELLSFISNYFWCFEFYCVGVCVCVCNTQAIPFHTGWAYRSTAWRVTWVSVQLVSKQMAIWLCSILASSAIDQVQKTQRTQRTPEQHYSCHHWWRWWWWWWCIGNDGDVPHHVIAVLWWRMLTSGMTPYWCL